MATKKTTKKPAKHAPKATAKTAEIEAKRARWKADAKKRRERAAAKPATAPFTVAETGSATEPMVLVRKAPIALGYLLKLPVLEAMAALPADVIVPVATLAALQKIIGANGSR